MSYYINKIPIHTTVSKNSHKDAKKYNVAWSYALEIGIRQAIAERNGTSKNENGVLAEKVEKLARISSRQQETIWKLEEELKKNGLQKKLG